MIPTKSSYNKNRTTNSHQYQKKTKPKKIEKIVILNDRSIVDGGTSQLAFLQLKLAAKNKIKTFFISGDFGFGKKQKINTAQSLAIGTSNINPAKPLDGMIPGLWNQKAFKLITDWIKHNDTPKTFYHLHGWIKNLSPSVLAALEPVAARTVLHAHDFFLTCPNGGIFNYQSSQICLYKGGSTQCFLSQCDSRNAIFKYWRFLRHKIIERLKTPLSSKIVLVHKNMKEVFIKNGYPPKNLSVVQNPVIPFVSKRINAENNKIFFFIGRLSDEKGCLEFLEASQKECIPTAVIGDGYQKPFLQKLFPDTKFYGWKDKNKIAKLIKRARCVVVPTKSPETFGLVAMESIASGIPVLISISALLAKDIKKYKIGTIFSHDKHLDLRKKLQLLKQNSDLINKYSRNGILLWKKICNTPDQWFSEILKIYCQQIKK